jgi:hypothetical protein
MARIEVSPVNDTDTRFDVTVRDEDGSETKHEVTVTDPDWERFGDGYASRADLVEASVRFLVAREPKESILSSFDLGVIARYFPEYETTIRPST